MQLGTRAVPPRRVGANVGSRVGGVATANRSHANARASMHLRYRTESGDAVMHRCPPRQAWPNCPSHLAMYARRSTHKQMRMHYNVYPSTDQYIYAHTHCCAGVCGRAGGMRESECKGEGAAWTLEHLPGRRAMRSSRERRRAAVELQHVSARPSCVGTRRWCGGDSCHGCHAHPHRTQVGIGVRGKSALARIGVSATRR